MGAIENKPLLRRILKAFGLFGSVEGLLILFSIIRTKLVAVFLGSSGIGLFGIFLSAIDLISTTTQLNLNESAVRDLASCANESQRSRTIVSISRWSWVLGAAGAVVMIVAAPIFSYYTFGGYGWTWAYVVLAIVVLLNSLTKGFRAILCGLEAFRSLASAQVYGAAFGLLVSIPLIYYLKLDSIIPSFVAYAVSTFLAACLICSGYMRRHVKKDSIPGFRRSLADGSSFIRLGAYMTVSAFASLASSYIFMAWLNENADTSTVGHFNAGFTIVNRYVGIILGAIAVEYYPRLSRENSMGMSVERSVNTEIGIGLTLLLPCVCLFMVASRLVVPILYSSDFDIIIPFVNWAMIGTMLRLFSWCLAYVILAKGDGRIYVVTEVLSAIVYVVSSILCYRQFGIVGLGYSYIVWYALYTVSVAVVYRFRYHLHLKPGIWLRLFLSLVVAVIAAMSSDHTVWAALAIAAITGVLALRKIKEAF